MAHALVENLYFQLQTILNCMQQVYLTCIYDIIHSHLFIFMEG